MLTKLKHLWAIILVLALVAATVASVGIVAAGDSNDGDVITACVQKNNGMLRVVDDCDECRQSEVCRSWHDCDWDALDAEIDALAVRVWELEQEGQSCDDGDGCTENDIWGAGECIGTPKDCNDGNPCTLDSCENNECIHDPILECCLEDADCDDGDPCTIDSCLDGECMNDQSPRLTVSDSSFDLSTLTCSGIEELELVASNAVLTLSAADVLRVSEIDQLTIRGGIGNAVVSIDIWVSSGWTVVDGIVYNVFMFGPAVLLIQDGIDVTGIIL